MERKPKVKVTIMLDEDPKKIVVEHLANLGMSFSGFLNAMVVALAKEIQGQPVIPDKPIDQLTLKEFGELASFWFQKAAD